jgi:hypothetical protein
MQIAVVIGMVLAAQAPQLDPGVKAAWETIKGLEGEWYGQASDGRKIHHSVQLFAGGASVLERSWFEAHPNEMMVTIYHLDQGRLMLTHYCVAGNQPRMRASEISPDGKKLLFTFFDGTNLRDRDQGHMDKASYEFIDKDTFKSNWTWYSKGKEQWMEAFTFKRGTPPPSKDGAAPMVAQDKKTCCGG